MNTPKHLNHAMDYIEANLCAELELDEIARRACVTADSFQRFFSYMTGMTLTEYIRRRRLTVAADDLLHSNCTVMDIAVRYGYDSAAAFSRAFARQHGVTPSFYRKYGGAVKVYPPASFHIVIKGASEMDLRMIELKETTVLGISMPYDGQGYKSKEELRHLMWSGAEMDVPGQLCAGSLNQAGDSDYDGTWYGIWQAGRYMIAREEENVKDGDFQSFVIPAGTYAAFKTPCGSRAWEEFPKLFELIFDSWLPSSNYRQKGDLAIEVLHLWGDHDLRQKKRWYEVWIPVEQK